jgi:4-amino-4-deoxy-L-arabinose transferase-like glycosyltransferase
MWTKLKPSSSWRVFLLPIAIILSFAIILFMYTWRLGVLTPGMSSTEVSARKSSQYLNSIKENPINAPHKLGQLAFQNLGHHGSFWMRSVSVAAAIILLVFLFLLLREWFGNFIAILGTLFFAATPWIVLLARNAAPDIMLLSPVAIITSFILLSRSKKWTGTAWIFFAVISALSLYTPGVIWFVLIATLLAYRSLIKEINRVNGPLFMLGIVLFLLILVPLGYGIYLHTSVAKDALLYPHVWQHPIELLKSFAWSASSLGIKMRQHFDYTIGRLPILNIAMLILAFVGIYGLLRGAKNQVYLLFTLVVIAILASGINNSPLYLTLCLPVVAIFVAAGLRYLYMQWSKIFPVNPLPKALAILLTVLLVSFQVAYGMRYTLIAWPHTVATKSTYVLK